MPARVAIIGGGIAGLAAALRLADTAGDVELTLVERGDRLGGKLRTGQIAGRTVETCAETFLAREADDPSGAPSAAVRLAHRVGLGGALTHPATTAAAVLAGDGLRPIPGGTLMGVPARVSDLDGLAGPADPAADADLGRPVLGAGEDVSVGALVRSRIGDAVTDRLVDPLLGGVYAGRADDLSLAVTMPGLAQACREEHTLRGAVRLALSRRSPAPGPVFATVEGGLSRLVEAVAAAVPGLRVLRGRPATSLARPGDGWRITLGPTPDPRTLDADAVVLAVPSHPAARLLAGVSPEAAAAVGALDYASIGLVSMLLPPGALGGTGLDGRSGALVPAVAGHLVKAVTVFSTKWSPQPDGAVLLRVSIGRYGEEHALAPDDGSLATLALDDLSAVVGRHLPAPLAYTVHRWGGALPQYRPGHLDRVGSARAALPPTLALAGAAFDGVGIPACVRSGERAADRIAAALGGQ